jgi:hypothetical protein
MTDDETGFLDLTTKSLTGHLCELGRLPPNFDGRSPQALKTSSKF